MDGNSGALAGRAVAERIGHTIEATSIRMMNGSRPDVQLATVTMPLPVVGVTCDTRRRQVFVGDFWQVIFMT